MQNYTIQRFYKDVEMIDFDEGAVTVDQEINPAEALTEGYEVDQHKEYERLRKVFTSSRDPLIRSHWKFAQYWGAYMEEEMARTGRSTLTPSIMNATEEVLGEWNNCGDWGYANIPYILATTWKHGETLAKINPFLDTKEVHFHRALLSDSAYSICEKFKAEKNKTPELRAQYLADVLQTPELLSYLQRQLKEKDYKPKEVDIFTNNLAEVLPMLPQRNLIELQKVITTAKNIVNERKSGKQAVKSGGLSQETLYNCAYLKKLKNR